MSKQKGKIAAKIICAWCKKELGEKEGIEGTTHSICKECSEKVKQTEINQPETRKSDS